MGRQNKNVQYKYTKLAMLCYSMYYTMFLSDHFSRQKIDGGKKWNLLFVRLHFRNKRFMLDEMTRRNASKFAIFFINENPQICFFHFSFRATLIFPPNECHGIFIRGKSKVARKEIWKR